MAVRWQVCVIDDDAFHDAVALQHVIQALRQHQDVESVVATSRSQVLARQYKPQLVITAEHRCVVVT